MNDLKKVIYLGPDFGYKAVVDEFGDLAGIFHVDPSYKALQNALLDADAIIDASMKVKITDEMVKEAPHLKIIFCATTGSGHIERTEIGKRSIIQLLTLKEDSEFLLNLTPAYLMWCSIINKQIENCRYERSTLFRDGLARELIVKILSETEIKGQKTLYYNSASVVLNNGKTL